MKKQAIILAVAALLGPASTMAQAQYYVNSGPTWLDRVFGSGSYPTYQVNPGYYANPVYYGHHGRACYRHGWNGNNGWHNGWGRHRH